MRTSSSTARRGAASPRRRGIETCVAAFVLLTLLAACEKKREAKRPRPPVPASLGKVTSGDAPLILTGLGHVEANATVSVKARVTGRLDKSLFRDGARIEKGELLFSIDPVPFKLALAEAAANLAQAKTASLEADREAARFLKLMKSGTVSPEEGEAKAAKAAEAKAAVLASRARLNIASQNLEYCSIKSYIGGLAGKRLVDDGNLVTANGATLVVVNQINPIRVRFSIPEKRLAEVQAYAAKSAEPLHVEAKGVGPRDGTKRGSLRFINNQVDVKTGAIALEALFDNKDGRLWPGQFVTARLLLTVQKNVVQAPYVAVQTGPQGSYVFVVKADRRVEIRKVVRGRRMGDRIVILKGLKAGETVVTDGQLSLYSGAKVAPTPSPDDTKKKAEKPGAAAPPKDRRP